MSEDRSDSTLLERRLLAERLTVLDEAVRETEAVLDDLRAHGRAVEATHSRALASAGWRVTEPMRGLAQRLRRRGAAAGFAPVIAAGRLEAKAEDAARRAETLRAIHHLWGGLSSMAVPALERIAADPAYGRERYDALVKLSTWYAFEGDYAKALTACRAIEALPWDRDRPDRLMREGFIHAAIGDPAGARAAFAKLSARGWNADAALALANYAADDGARLAAVNGVLTRARLAPIRRADPARPLGFDNLASDAPAVAASSGRVSVILPCYNAEATIEIALRSLMAQSYADLEILVVDDCSTDATAERVAALAARDPRIRLIRQAANAGAYTARNRGLAVASGAFVTTHDADDWSHPQKIERQVATLAKQTKLAGVCCYWARARPDLRVTPNWRILRRVLYFSHSSFLFRRVLADELGPWDPVRVGADTDFIARVRAAKGEKSVATILPDAPLAFALDAESSLTRAKVTHVRSVYFGLRQIYHAVARVDRERPGGPALRDWRWRHAALPPEALHRVEGPVELDFLLIGDCTDPAILARMRGEIAARPGAEIGIFHWPSFAAPPRDLPNAYAMLIAGAGVRAVLPGAKVRLGSRFGIFLGHDHAPVDGPFELVR